MLYRVAADLVVAAHATFVAFVVLGSLLVRRWPRLAWVHGPAVVYSALIIFVGFTCPLTTLEDALRRRGGEHVASAGFIDHYIKGQLYPRDLNTVVQVLVGAVIVAGYLRLLTLRAATRTPSQPSFNATVTAVGRHGDDRHADQTRRAADGDGQGDGSRQTVQRSTTDGVVMARPPSSHS